LPAPVATPAVEDSKQLNSVADKLEGTLTELVSIGAQRLMDSLNVQEQRLGAVHLRPEVVATLKEFALDKEQKRVDAEEQALASFRDFLLSTGTAHPSLVWAGDDADTVSPVSLEQAINRVGEVVLLTEAGSVAQTDKHGARAGSSSFYYTKGAAISTDADDEILLRLSCILRAIPDVAHETSHAFDAVLAHVARSRGSFMDAIASLSTPMTPAQQHRHEKLRMDLLKEGQCAVEVARRALSKQHAALLVQRSKQFERSMKSFRMTKLPTGKTLMHAASVHEAVGAVVSRPRVTSSTFESIHSSDLRSIHTSAAGLGIDSVFHPDSDSEADVVAMFKDEEEVCDEPADPRAPSSVHDHTFVTSRPAVIIDPSAPLADAKLKVGLWSELQPPRPPVRPQKPLSARKLDEFDELVDALVNESPRGSPREPSLQEKPKRHPDRLYYGEPPAIIRRRKYNPFGRAHRRWARTQELPSAAAESKQATTKFLFHTLPTPVRPSSQPFAIAPDVDDHGWTTNSSPPKSVGAPTSHREEAQEKLFDLITTAHEDYKGVLQSMIGKQTTVAELRTSLRLASTALLDKVGRERSPLEAAARRIQRAFRASKMGRAAQAERALATMRLVKGHSLGSAQVLARFAESVARVRIQRWVRMRQKLRRVRRRARPSHRLIGVDPGREPWKSACGTLARFIRQIPHLRHLRKLREERELELRCERRMLFHREHRRHALRSAMVDKATFLGVEAERQRAEIDQTMAQMRRETSERFRAWAEQEQVKASKLILDEAQWVTMVHPETKARTFLDLKTGATVSVHPKVLEAQKRAQQERKRVNDALELDLQLQLAKRGAVADWEVVSIAGVLDRLAAARLPDSTLRTPDIWPSSGATTYDLSAQKWFALQSRANHPSFQAFSASVPGLAGAKAPSGKSRSSKHSISARAQQLASHTRARFASVLSLALS
jgi:hypothetical protein